MKFSLIIGTLNRRNTIEYCLQSLLDQEYTDYEIIIIDQSVSDETRHYVESVTDNRIIYEKVDFKGLSRARNRGIELASGDYICLIDDDAYYDCRFLSNAADYYEHYKKTNILSGYIFNTETNKQFTNYKSCKNMKKLSYSMIIHTCPSAGLVIPITVFNNCGGFDNNFGVGGEFGAGEETDFLLRAINMKYSVVYLKELMLKHPYPNSDMKHSHDEIVKKMKSYYRGIGALYKKHLFINREYQLVPDYLLIRLKFLAKRVTRNGKDLEKVENEFDGFLSGIRDYCIL